jgi:[acyl-carrier-protein] S-malonyltransferase
MGSQAIGAQTSPSTPGVRAHDDRGDGATVAWVFPGQGAQRVGMGVDLADSDPHAAEVFTRASAAIGRDLLRLCREGPDSVLERTEVTQPALLTACLAVLAAARDRLPAPAWVAGLSLGEWTALAAAGALTVEDAVRLVAARGRLMEAATRGRDVGMLVVTGLTEAQVGALAREVANGEMCVPANMNTPVEIAVGGDRAALRRLEAACAAAGAVSSWLPVSTAFHTQLMAPVAGALGPLLDRTPLSPLRVPLMSCVDAAPVTDAGDLRALLVRQVVQPTRWGETVLRLAHEGVDTVVELGPGRSITGMVRRTAPWLRRTAVGDAASLERLETRLARAGRPR